MSHTYEVEIKSLLGSPENAQALKSRLQEHGDVEEVGKHSQLNHYFTVTPDDILRMKEMITPHIPEDKKEALVRILEEGENHSVRTRDADGTVLFVIKASLDEGTSSNTVSRIEFEEEVDMSIDELDQLLLDAGLEYQAKWSRDREEFKVGDTNVTIDRNAGYGYLAEFERVTNNESELGNLKEELLGMMEQFGVEELPQDRLERMFEFYNKNWEDYYGTDKIFTIE